jgi:hypothetical protein
MFQYLVGAFGGVATLLILLAFFGRTLLSQLLRKELKRYESELNAKTDILKTQLSIYAHEQTVALSRIDTQRAEAIRQVFSSIAKWNKVISTIKSPDLYLIATTGIDSYFNDLKKKLFESIEHLADTMLENAIFFSSETYDRIANVYRLLLLYSHEIDINISEAFHSGKITDDEIIDIIHESISKCSTIHTTKIDPIRGQLVDEFRKLMGAQ